MLDCLVVNGYYSVVLLVLNTVISSKGGLGSSFLKCAQV